MNLRSAVTNALLVARPFPGIVRSFAGSLQSLYLNWRDEKAEWLLIDLGSG